MNNLKVDSMIVRFDGSSDVLCWLEKVELVCSLQGITEPVKVIPLLLEGSAFAVYQQMAATEKTKLNSVKDALMTAFSIDAFEAYENLKVRSWIEGESVDVYAAELKKLLLVCKLTSDAQLILALVTGLPADVSRELRSHVKTKPKATVSEIIAHARILMTNRVATTPYAALVSNTTKMSLQQYDNDAARKNNGVQSVKCYNCGGMGHFSRQCPSNSHSHQGPTTAPYPSP